MNAFSRDFKVIIIQILKGIYVFNLHSLIPSQFINGIPKIKQIFPSFVKKNTASSKIIINYIFRRKTNFFP